LATVTHQFKRRWKSSKLAPSPQSAGSDDRWRVCRRTLYDFGVASCVAALHVEPKRSTRGIGVGSAACMPECVCSRTPTSCCRSRTMSLRPVKGPNVGAVAYVQATEYTQLHQACKASRLGPRAGHPQRTTCTPSSASRPKSRSTRSSRSLRCGRSRGADASAPKSARVSSTAEGLNGRKSVAHMGYSGYSHGLRGHGLSIAMGSASSHGVLWVLPWGTRPWAIYSDGFG
jgi:hypothetical protein